MEATKEYLHNSLSDEESQNKGETVTDDNMSNVKLNMCNDNCLITPDFTHPDEKGLCNFQRDDENEGADLDKKEAYIEANNKILNEESVCKNIKEIIQLESTLNSLKASEEINVHATPNRSTLSGNSSSEEEILQTRFSVENEVYVDKYHTPQSTTSFVSVSDKESIKENDPEVKKAPIIIQAKVYKKKSVDYESDSSSKGMKETGESVEKEATTDITNYNSLYVEGVTPNLDIESSYMQNSINSDKDLNFNIKKDGNEASSQFFFKNAVNEEATFDQNLDKINDMSVDTIIDDFLNGSLDISVFLPEKKSSMIKDEKMATQENELGKDKHSLHKEQKYGGNVYESSNYNKKMYSSFNDSNKAKHKKINSNDKNFADSTDNSVVHLKRKLSRKQIENSKKAMIIEKNKDEVLNLTSDIINIYNSRPKTRSEKKDSKANNQQQHINNKKRKDKNLNIFDKTENSKRSKAKKNTTRTKGRNKEKILQNLSYKISPFKKSRDLRNSSLIASKKIKEIEKLENSYEEVCLDSDNSCFDSSNEKFQNNYKSISKERTVGNFLKTDFGEENDKFLNQDTISIVSSDNFQFFSAKKEEMKNDRITRSNRKRKNMFEGILDACRITAKPELKMNKKTPPRENFISEINYPDIFVEENRDMYEKCHNNKKRVNNRRLSKNDKITENKLLKNSKNIDNITSYKTDTLGIMNSGAITRSKKKTWEMLEKELLGESNDVSLSNNVTKTVALKEQSVGKQNIKDADLYSISEKSAIQTVSMSTQKSKCDVKYKMQDIKSKSLRAPANTVQSDSNTFIDKKSSNEIVSCKSKNILEKTIAAMEKCTEKFAVPKVNFTEKEWMNNEQESDDISIDQQAEFHSNMTFVTNKNEQYYKNEIFTVLKQSNSKKSASSRRNKATKTVYNDEEYKYGFTDAEHLVKRRIITESYSVKNNVGEEQKIESQALIISEKKQIDPWSRLIKELNLEQNNETKGQNILKERPCMKSLIYHENLKQDTTTNLNTDEVYKQDAKAESELEVLQEAIFEETVVLPNRMAICSGLNVKDNYSINNTNSKRNKNKAESDNEYPTKRLEKLSKKIKTGGRQAFQMKKVKKSPKFKLHIEDGGVKFKRCIGSLSSSSEESEKQKQGNTKHNDKKIPDDQKKLEIQEYKKYLNNLFERNLLEEEKVKMYNRKTESINKEKSSKRNPIEDERKMIHNLMAKDVDVFSLSSSDSETVSKKSPGSGLLCDVFDE